MPSVQRVYFQQILSDIITRLYALAKRKMNPRGRQGVQESVKLFLSGNSCWKILSTAWEENPDGKCGNARKCIGFLRTIWILINSQHG